MELIQRYQVSRDSSSASGFNNFNNSWLTQNKNLLRIIAGVVVAIIVFVGGYFTGRSVLLDNSSTEGGISNSNNSTYDSRVSSAVFISTPGKAPPPIIWDGVCPRIAEKCPESFQGIPPLILVSLDGFHPDYLKRGLTPTISKLAQCGTSTDFLYPIFPSKTFPNHFTIVTGLYPASHGIVDNNMYDPYKRKLFKVGSPEMYQPYWYQKNPIWVTAEKQGRTTASFFWPGTDVKINNTMPSYNRRYSSKLNFDVRVDQVLAWLELPPTTRPSFITLYVNQPDHEAHWSGTKSQQVNQSLSNVDKMITRLFAGLQLRNLTDCVNIIILSDHGMSDVNCKRLVDIQKYMNVSEVYATMGPFGRLRPKKKSPTVADVVSKLKCQSEHMRVYPKQQLPVRMHFADNARIEPIFLDLDSGWTVVSKSAKDGDEICTGGAHGYDNAYYDMRALFLAHGPSIKKNNTVMPFLNVEIYELLAELIDIIPNPNNGTRGSLHHILKAPVALSSYAEPKPPITSYVPEDTTVYNDRVKASNCSCPQSFKTPQQVDVKNKMEKGAEHLPFGVPYSSSDNNTLRLLYNEDYILSFHLKYRIPMWTAFTLDAKKTTSELSDVCWIGDARIPSSNAPKCGSYSSPLVQERYILQRPLYPPVFSDPSLKDQAAYVTNAVPKSLNHTVIEGKLNQIIDKWTKESGKLNVIMGTAFDLLATGVKPDSAEIMKTQHTFGSLVVPTHIFVIATWCSVAADTIEECHSSKLLANGYLLPNIPFTQNCEAPERIIEKNAARVVDIEKLTGLSFYTALPTYDALRLRTMMPQRSAL